MFLSIYENRSGEEFLRRLAPNESLDLRQHVERWLDREFGDYDARAIFSEPGSHISNGCGDWQAEIRYTKQPDGVCWNSEPFFIELEEG